MIRWGLLLLSIGLTIVFMSFTTFSGTTHLTVNFLSYTLVVPKFVKNAHITLVENKSSIIAYVKIGSKVVQLPYSTYIGSGVYKFVVVEEVNASNGKPLNLSEYYNVTLMFKVVKAYAFSNPNGVFYQGIGVSIIGGVLLVREIKKSLPSPK